MRLTYEERAALSDLNDDPWLGADYVPFLVRLKGDRAPLGVVLARGRDELFWLVDELTDPYACEVTVLEAGEGFFCGIDNAPTQTESLAMRVWSKVAWRPLMDVPLTDEERADELSSFEKEVAELGAIFKDLRGKVNARHRRNPPEDDGNLVSGR